MRASLLHSRKGLSTIVAEVLMLLIVIILSSIVFVWVVPTFQSSTGQESNAAYAEKFSTLWGNFATFAPSNPETVYACTELTWANIPSGMCPVSSPTTCNAPTTSPITSPTTSNIFVPINGVCVIYASVGYVFASKGSNLTVVGTTIKGLVGDSSSIVTLKNVNVQGWTGLSDVQTVTISGSSFNTQGITTICTDNCNSAIYEAGRGTLTFVNNTVNGQFESEVSHQAIIIGNTITGRLEVESADFGQIMNNKSGMMDLAQNGILVFSGNTAYGNDPDYVPQSDGTACPSGTGTAICVGPNNRWCAAGNNIVPQGKFFNSPACIGNVEIDVTNTGFVPVNLVAAYMSGIPVSGPIGWKLFSGGPVHSSLPIVIPVGQSANVTMQWTPPPTSFTMPWMDVYFVFVSSHSNFVDGHLYFGYNPALTIPSQSRPENRICPPCY